MGKKRGIGVAVTAIGAIAILAASIGAGDGPSKSQKRDGGNEKADALAKMVKPEYDKQGGLLRPAEYERWVFVGTSLGISYSEGEEGKGPGQFHNVYIQPEAFEHYKTTGEFPEKTVFVMTNQPATKKDGPEIINKRGHFAGPATGLEVSVKDSERFEDGWAYFIFSTDGPRKAARAFPKSQCYDCHASHGEDDNVFVQFYSVLEEVRKKQGAK